MRSATEREQLVIDTLQVSDLEIGHRPSLRIALVIFGMEDECDVAERYERKLLPEF
jgi:hypothetical protein